jgi:hypothetical protein
MTFSSCADDGDVQAQRHVEDAVVAGTIVPSDPGPVESEDNRQPVEPHIQVGLVERPAEKRRVNGHYGA